VNQKFHLSGDGALDRFARQTGVQNQGVGKFRRFECHHLDERSGAWLETMVKQETKYWLNVTQKHLVEAEIIIMDLTVLVH